MFSLVGNMVPVLKKTPKICVSTTENYVSNTGENSFTGKLLVSSIFPLRGIKTFTGKNMFFTNEKYVFNMREIKNGFPLVGIMFALLGKIVLQS